MHQPSPLSLPQGAPSRGARLLAWILVGLAALLIASRTPDILLHGRLFAEEGVVYFRDAVLGSWYDALLAPRIGYFSAFNKLAALGATAVPLEEAARVTTLCALGVQLAVVWIIARSDAFGPLWLRPLAVAAPLFAQPSVEVWLNTINSQFHFAVGTAVLLVTGRAALPATFRVLFLLLAGATGPVSVTLAPLFAWKALRSRTRPDLIEAVLLCALAGLQTILMAQGLASGARAGSGFSVLALIGGLGVKNLALPGLGPLADAVPVALLSGTALGKGLVMAALACVAGLFALAVVRSPAGRWLGMAALLIAVVSYAGALGKDPWLLLLPLANGRYAYAPNVLMILAFVAAAAERATALPLRLLAAGLALGVVGVGMVQFWQPAPYFHGPAWRAEVAAWRADPSRDRLALWPVPWVLILPHPAPEARPAR